LRLVPRLALGQRPAARRECGFRCEPEDKTTLLEVRGSSVFDVLNFHIYAVTDLASITGSLKGKKQLS
jgi:hypothetical protein